jgi:hypothetical protein
MNSKFLEFYLHLYFICISYLFHNKDKENVESNCSLFIRVKLKDIGQLNIPNPVIDLMNTNLENLKKKVF